jgi:hypothetical protein
MSEKNDGRERCYQRKMLSEKDAVRKILCQRKNMMSKKDDIRERCCQRKMVPEKDKVRER